MHPKKASVDLGLTQRLREYLEASGLKWKASKTSYIFDCPKCRKTDKLWMYQSDGRFVCWHCAEIDGFKGRPEYALSELLNLPVRSIQKELYGSESPTVELFFDFKLENWWSNDEYLEEVPDLNQLPTILWGPDALPIDSPFATQGAEYLISRGIPLELAQSYGIHYSGSQMRVLFPVQYKRRLFGWQARYVGATEFWDEETGLKRTIPKVLTVEGLKKDKVVMFADRLTGSDQAIICEGPVDALKCHACSVDGRPAGNIATMGKAVSAAQIALLRYSGINRIYLALDPDAAAETERLVRELHEYMDVYLMEVPKPWKDFGEMSIADVAGVYRGARKVTPGRVYVYLKPECVLFRKRSKV